MLKCNSCGHVFSEEEVNVEVGEISLGYREEFDCCPACGDGDFEEAKECAVCGEYITVDERDPDAKDHICHKCGNNIMRKLWKVADQHFSGIELRLINDVLAEVCNG